MEQNNNQKNKKTLILSLVAVLVLVGSVVGVAYAMFSFSATGTQTNVIKTGYVTINFDNVTTINLTNALPIEDASVTEVTTGTGLINTMLFDVVSTINGTMTLNYDLGLSDFTEGTTLKKANVKIRLYKSTDNGSTWTQVLGTSGAGVLISSIADSTGTNGLLSDTKHAIGSGQFTTSGTHKYKLTAWIDSGWTLPSATAASSICVSATTGAIQSSLTSQSDCEAVTEAKNEWKVTTPASCSVAGNETEAECTAASGTWTAAVSQCVNKRTGVVDSSEDQTTCGTATVAANSWITPTGTCSNTAYGTSAGCYAVNGSWTQSKGTQAETFQFKVKVSASQAAA